MFDTLILLVVFLKGFFKKLTLKKKSADDNKSIKNPTKNKQTMQNQISRRRTRLSTLFAYRMHILKF